MVFLTILIDPVTGAGGTMTLVLVTSHILFSPYIS